MALRTSPLIVVLFAPLTSCGTLTPDGEGNEPRRDPVSGFIDGPGIEVCFGDRRIVSKSQAPDGPLSICLSPDSIAPSCASSADCRRGETCTCGRCLTRPCRDATQCDAGHVCQSNRCVAGCSSARGCAEGDVCNSGGCARPCSSDEGCAFGETCGSFDGTCVVKLCGEAVTCGGDEVCVAQEHVADLREPHVLEQAGTRWAFLAMHEPAPSKACAIHRARVVDARRWEFDPLQPVVEPGPADGGCVTAPTVTIEGETWLMAFARGDGSAILSARSADGASFERSDVAVLQPEAPWEGGRVMAPSLARWAGQLVLLYQAAGGIGVAEVQGEAARRLGAGAWLEPTDFEDPVLWHAVESIGSPFAVDYGGTLLVYLTVRGVEGSDATTPSISYPADTNPSIGLVATRDLVSIERFPVGPVFARRTNLRAYLGESEPSTFFSSGATWLVYTASDASGSRTTGLGMAQAPR